MKISLCVLLTLEASYVYMTFSYVYMTIWPDSASNEDFSGPHYKLRGMNHLSVNQLQRQHGCLSEKKRHINVSIIGINTDFNEKWSLVLCYIQSWVHIYGHAIQRNVWKKSLKFAKRHIVWYERWNLRVCASLFTMSEFNLLQKPDFTSRCWKI